MKDNKSPFEYQREYAAVQISKVICRHPDLKDNMPPYGSQRKYAVIRISKII